MGRTVRAGGLTLALVLVLGAAIGAPAAAGAATAIDSKYEQLKAAGVDLGAPTGVEVCHLAKDGCVRHYQGGSIYWREATGPHFLRGAIREKYSGLGWENGALAYPTGDEFCGLKGGGCGQHFEGGSVYWSPPTGAHPVWGSILGQWSEADYENGRFGYPTTDERNDADAWRQGFQGGTITIGKPAGESRFTAYTTGYTWWDNDPPGSAEISDPVLHQRAGGRGTWEDPITIAVGYTMSGGRKVMDYPKGTRFYIPDVRRYFIVEDICGACHAKNPPRIDMWLDGRAASKSVSNSCMYAATGSKAVAINPRSDYVVAGGYGVIHDGRCDRGYGNAFVLR